MKNKNQNSLIERFMELAGNDSYKDHFLSKNKKALKESFDDLDAPSANTPSESNDSLVDDSTPLDTEEETNEDSMDVDVDQLESEIQAAVSAAFAQVFGQGAVHTADSSMDEPNDFDDVGLDNDEPPMMESKEVSQKIVESVFESLKNKGFISKVNSKKKQ